MIQSRATDDSLNSETPSPGITINVASAGSSIFGVPSVANNLTADDGNAVELGVKFSTSTPGTIVGLSFYKNSINVGPHTAELWDATGNLLATATFAAELPSGWQSVLFATPVSISTGVTYTASYHTNGFYSAALNYFTQPVTSGYLTAPVNAGVYSYGASPSFPLTDLSIRQLLGRCLVFASGFRRTAGHHERDQRERDGRNGVHLPDYGDQ